MLPLWPLAVMFAASVVAMAATWELQRRTRNAGYVDVVWAALMAIAALFYSVVGVGADLPRLLVALLGGIWGIRLSLHLLARVLREPEDGRYRYLREHWGDDQRKLFGFFMAQAAFVAIFSLPFLVAASNHATQGNGWLVAAVIVWAISLGGESLADRQLAAFRADPANRGRACRAGLWRYSRHPNYFFEWLHWFAYLLLGAGSPWWWLALAGPLLMGASLVWFTGIPYVEAQALRSRGEDYRRYQQETSMFFPWFPKRAADPTGAGK
jgi:steroid 5-alpha reductase family enzyme